jgi:hypothetical protein
VIALDIDTRIFRLRTMLVKTASTIPKIKMPDLKIENQNTLFPKLQGPNKPPKLTSDSQPKLDINKIDLPTLPTMRENGRDPLFSSELKIQSPYQKN